jgi:hypothetical protein
MASTYRSPETVVVSEAKPIVDTINAFANVYVTTAGRIKAINDAKVKKTLEQNAQMMKDISIDPTKFYAALGERNADQALFGQVNNLMDENTRLQLGIEAGLYSSSDYRELLGKKNKTLSELSQLVSLAESEKLATKAWIESKATDNLSSQGGKSVVNNENFIAAKNILTSFKKGKVERIFKDNTMFYRISGQDLDEPYEAAASEFLSKQLTEVPKFDEEWKDLLVQKGLLTTSGAKTDYFKNNITNEEDFDRIIGLLVGVKVKGMVSNFDSLNSTAVEIFGAKNPFQEYAGPEITDKGFPPGSKISREDVAIYTDLMSDYVKNITPAWEAKAPKDPKQLPKWMKDAKNLEDQKTAWQDRLEQRVTTLGLGINKEGEVFTGEIKPFNAEGNIRPEFEKALSGLGYSIEKKINQDLDSNDPKAIAVEISMPGISGNKVRIFQDQIAQDFIYNLALYTFGKNQMDWAGKYSGKFKGQKFN